MKHYLIPYIVAGRNGDWWGGIDFYNLNEEFETNATIRIYRHSNGVLASTIVREIQPGQHSILDGDTITKNLVEADEGRATIFVDCSDDVYISTFMGRLQGFSLVPHCEISELKK